MTDPALHNSDLMTLLHAEIEKNGFGKPHKDSFNKLIDEGLADILMKAKINTGEISNERDSTAEDKHIRSMSVEVFFTNVRVEHPPQFMTPKMARDNGLTYKLNVSVNAEIIAKTINRDRNNTEGPSKRVLVNDISLMEIPCMLKSNKCVLSYMTREGMLEAGEDPDDPGCTFIVRGNEWIIKTIENTPPNVFQVSLSEGHKGELVRGYILSKAGEKFENSYQTLIRLYEDGRLTVSLQSGKKDSIEIPFHYLFYMYDQTSDEMILDFIMPDHKGQNDTMMQMLERALKTPCKYGINPENMSTGDMLKAFTFQRTSIPRAGIDSDEKEQYMRTSTLKFLDDHFLPHAGSTPEARIHKLRVFGTYIRTLFNVALGLESPTSRDSPKFKRYLSAGANISKTMKTLVGLFTSSIVNTLTKACRQTTFSEIDFAHALTVALQNPKHKEILSTAITSGNKSELSLDGRKMVNHVGGQSLNRKNDLFVLVALHTVEMSDKSAASRQEGRSVEARMPLPDFNGFIDFIHTAESMPTLGAIKLLGIATSITESSPGNHIITRLKQDRDILSFDSTTPATIYEKGLSCIRVNGNIIGCCSHRDAILRKYRKLRREGELDWQVSIESSILSMDINFWSDHGRLIRPLVIVYNNIDEFKEQCRKRVKDDKAAVPIFKQWIKLTAQHISDLKRGKISMKDLREQQIIEYITPQEQDCTYVARNIDVLRKHENDPTNQYTHMDIDQASFGVTTLSCPSPQHSDTLRTAYATNHLKSCVKPYPLNYPTLMARGNSVSMFNQVPLVRTFMDQYLYPSGYNVVSAINTVSGFASDDSSVVLVNIVACGVFHAVAYNTEKVQAGPGERIGSANVTKTVNNKDAASYAHLQDGVIREGTVITKDTVLVLKTAMNSHRTDIQEDKSMVYRPGEPILIDKTIRSVTDDNIATVKVRQLYDRTLKCGDKLSSREGNKMTVAKFVTLADAWMTEDGMPIGIMMSPFSFFTRQAMNQIKELHNANLAAKLGCFIDGTIYMDTDTEKLAAEHNVVNESYRYIIDGRLGTIISRPINVGLATIVRLPKYSETEKFDSTNGPVKADTKQPVEGKQNNGGIRLGEMEKDVLAVHGSKNFIDEKYGRDSCGAANFICERCNDIMTVNTVYKIYRCSCPKNMSQPVVVQTNSASQVMINELRTAGIKMKMRLKQPIFV